MNARSGIPKAYVDKLKDLLVGSGDYVTNMYGNVFNKVMHFQEIQNFPTITVTPGPETRQDMPSNFTLCRLDVFVRIYVSDEDDPQAQLEKIIGDLENFFDNNLDIEYNLLTNEGSIPKRTISNTLISITTDEGLLSPQGVGELVFSVEYEKMR